MDLGSLPLEVIQKIISHGTCASALVLRSVNKLFHAICSKPLTYLELVKYGNDFDDDDQPDSKFAKLYWWPVGVEDWSIAARWACADMKLQYGRLNQQNNGPQLDNLYWLPELVVARHPQALGGSILPKTSTVSNCDFETFARCLWYGTFQCLCYRNADIQVEQAWPDSSFSIVPSYFRSIMVIQRLQDLLHMQGFDLLNSRELFIRRQFSAGRTANSDLPITATQLEMARMIAGTAMVAVLYRSLHAHLLRDSRTQYSADHSRSLPQNQDLPLKCLYPQDLIPASRRSGAESPIDFGTSFLKQQHLPVMTSANFLISGKWMGYYCYMGSFNPAINFRRDPVMENIRFRAQADYPDHCAVASVGKGRDAWGDFLLYGTVHKQNGTVQMTKQYDNGTTWAWSAIMSPFGIIGSWGEERWGGWLWLWPAEWNAG